MVDKIKIEHKETSFHKRRNHYLFIFIIIVTGFFLWFWFEKNLKNAFLPLLIFVLVFGVFILFKIFKNRLYLVGFESDSNNARIRYFKEKTEFIENVDLKNIEVKLKNTSSRSGFNCELILSINGKKFIVEDTFDWTLLEMKDLFEYIKKNKNEFPSEKEKFTISRMEIKIKKLVAKNSTVA